MVQRNLKHLEKTEKNFYGLKIDLVLLWLNFYSHKCYITSNMNTHDYLSSTLHVKTL